MCYLNQDIDQYYRTHIGPITFATLGRFRILILAYNTALNSLGNGVSEYPPISSLFAPFLIASARSRLRGWREGLTMQHSKSQC
jgi:hypothetical protein